VVAVSLVTSIKKNLTLSEFKKILDKADRKVEKIIQANSIKDWVAITYN
jgi:hypothetical protein